ncbi:MAG: hypothetical protein AAFY31_08590, partial [Pseudomonadota bacterium]
MSSHSPLARALRLAAFLVLSAMTLGPAAVADTADVPDYVVEQFGAPPPVPDGALPEALSDAINTAFVDSVTQSLWGPDQNAALEVIKASGDPRVAWTISDLMRFASGPQLNLVLADAAATLLKIETPRTNHWGVITDHLIAWDIPAPPDYLTAKR